MSESDTPQKKTDILEKLLKLFQVITVVSGVVISVIGFNNTRKKEADARKYEAAKPFLELRQKSYLEVVHAAAVLANGDHTDQEIAVAKKRFRELFVAELSMVESESVEHSMMELAKRVDPTLFPMTEKQTAAYDLAHALRDSLVASWNVDQKVVDNPNRQ